MREVAGDLWAFPATLRVITTNGSVKRSGECVMGRGCAKEAATRWPVLPMLLGRAIQDFGNIPHYFEFDDPGRPQARILTLPVKHFWDERANIDLIERGIHVIRTIALLTNQPIVMPRPGCGNGSLHWEDVRPVIAPLLYPDNIYVIDFPRPA